MSEFGVRPCQFRYGDDACEETDTRRYDMADGGEVWLCIRHRSWLPALGWRHE
jgi:hypothetical protein